MHQLREMRVFGEKEAAAGGGWPGLLGTTLPAASVPAARLVRAGYFDRNEDTDDRRRVLLTLTRAGIQLVTDLREGSHAHLRRWMSRLSPEDLAALTRGWRALADVASPSRQPAETTVV